MGDFNMPRGEGLKKVFIKPDADLARVIGPATIPALQLSGKVWAYIKANNLMVK